MNRLVVNGFKPGLRKIQLTRLLQARARLSLPEAKGVVDAVLEGRSAVVEIPSGLSPVELAGEIAALGAICEVTSAPD
ncbi:MAG: hypothetical protein ACK47B_04810 [Armatimonadota bacterium]